MACTRQTAKQSTGGTAPMGKLRPSNGTVETTTKIVSTVRAGSKKQVEQAKRSARHAQVTTTERSHDKFCFLCHDGGQALQCDTCRRIVCVKHISKFTDLSPVQVEVMQFMCPSCHQHRVVQSRKAGENGEASEGAYKAFYMNHDGILMPIFAGGVELQVDRPVGQHARINTADVMILELRLASMRKKGSVARVVYEALCAYFVDDEENNLSYKEVAFDLQCTKDIKKHAAALTRAVVSLRNRRGVRVLLFIHTHSHDEAGTLYYGTEAASESVEDWFEYLIPENVRALLRDQDTTVFMLCCGALVSTERSFKQLKDNCELLGIPRLLAFEAKSFQAALAMPFFLAYIYKFIIENAHFDDMQLGNILSQSVYLGRHTKVIVLTMKRGTDNLEVAEYTWCSKTVRPWGNELPVQCKVCKALFTFKTTTLPNGGITARCGEKCGYSLHYPVPEGQRLKGVDGVWLKKVKD